MLFLLYVCILLYIVFVFVVFVVFVYCGAVTAVHFHHGPELRPDSSTIYGRNYKVVACSCVPQGSSVYSLLEVC